MLDTFEILGSIWPFLLYNPDSKWKLGQHWVLRLQFSLGQRWLRDAKPSSLCSSKKCWPNMLYKRWPDMLYKRWPNMLYKRWPNMLYKRWPNILSKRWPNMLYKRWPNMLGKRWLSVSKWKLLTMFFFY